MNTETGAVTWSYVAKGMARNNAQLQPGSGEIVRQNLVNLTVNLMQGVLGSSFGVPFLAINPSTGGIRGQVLK